MKLFVLIDCNRDPGNDIAGIFETEEKAYCAARQLGLTDNNSWVCKYELNKIEED